MRWWRFVSSRRFEEERVWVHFCNYCICSFNSDIGYRVERESGEEWVTIYLYCIYRFTFSSNRTMLVS